MRYPILASLLAFTLACAGEPQPVTEDELPDDIYSVMQDAQAHYDSVLAERLTLTTLVASEAPAIGGYLEATDARGNAFSANGVVQDVLQGCMDRSADLPEVLDETNELLVALDKGHVGLARFKLRFADFDAAWQAENDCWREVWENVTFANWRARWAAQRDSMAVETEAARKRRAAEARARAAVAEKEAAFRHCVVDWSYGTYFHRDGALVSIYVERRMVARYVRREDGTYGFARMAHAYPAWLDIPWWEALTFLMSDLSWFPRVREAVVVQWMEAGHPGCEREP